MNLLSKVTTGRKGRAQKVVIYAPEGFGKSTLAGRFPQPLFLDVEDSTSQLDVTRLGRDVLPNLRTFESALLEVAQARPCATLVVDTVDWLEQLALEAIVLEARSLRIRGLEDFGYGKGYVLLKERMVRVLGLLDGVVAAGITVVLVAHARTVKHESPEGTGSFDRAELKLTRQVAPLVKEWADLMIFGQWSAPLRTLTAPTAAPAALAVMADAPAEDAEAAGEEPFATGPMLVRERRMHCQHAAGWDAKNRHGLGESEPWDVAVIERAFSAVGATWGLGERTAPLVMTPFADEAERGGGSPTLALMPPAGEGPDGEAARGPEAVELARICEPQAEQVNAYLARVGKIRPGESYRSLGADYRRRILRNPAGFLKVALEGKAVAA